MRVLIHSGKRSKVQESRLTSGIKGMAILYNRKFLTEFIKRLF